ncbi:O-antigen ligase family protein [Aurantiacibacter odishensis]|uniref:O-antigen ligase family protein n=1 Tax=Aurantiacibacter odishensis TaxID=1155476 RepID=UPI0013C539FE|nr:O-antigen ligase family protein [Aurantiacibacter odishensis]
MRGRQDQLSWGKSLSVIDRPQLALLATLLIAAALLGGSSRYDVMQNALMQPIAWVVAGFALVFAGAVRTWPKELRWPLAMLLTLLVLAAAQLVPLSESLWSGLPGREPLADIAAAINSDAARPMSMVPSRTLNALAALGIPLAALLVMAGMGQRGVYPLLASIVALALLSALLGILQITTGYSDAGYFYRITSEGAPVGIFANRNHTAVFGSLALLVIAFLVTRQERRAFPGADVLLWSAYGAIFLTILVNGSRAGLLTTGIAMAATALLVIGSRDAAQLAKPGRKGGARSVIVRYLPAAVIIVFAAIIVAIFLLADRLAAFQRIVAQNPLEDLRFRVVPQLIEMIETYFPLGTGLGAFERTYRIHEASDLLGPNYLNMAHNDWLQWLIETGLPGLILLLAFLIWLGFHLLRLRRVGRGHLVLGIAGFAIFAVASYFDYPLRTPLFQVAGVWFFCALALLGNAAARGTTRDQAIAAG